MIGQKKIWIFFDYYSIIDSGCYFTVATCMHKKTKNADILKLVEILESIALSSKIKWVSNSMLKHYFGLCELII